MIKNIYIIFFKLNFNIFKMHLYGCCYKNICLFAYKYVRPSVCLLSVFHPSVLPSIFFIFIATKRFFCVNIILDCIFCMFILEKNILRFSVFFSLYIFYKCLFLLFYYLLHLVFNLVKTFITFIMILFWHFFLFFCIYIKAKLIY